MKSSGTPVTAPSRLPITLSSLIVLALPLTGCALLGPWSPSAGLERRLLFQPARYPEGDWAPTAIHPEDCWFTAADGTRLHGWYLGHPHPRETLLFCHGNAGNITLLTDWLARLNRGHQLAVMTFDYRGYGRSEGTPTEEGILQDARAARAWLADRQCMAEENILLMGQSLGGAVAIDLAAKDGALGLIVLSSFTSVPDVALDHAPWLPAWWVLTMRLNSLEKLSKYAGPVLIGHGDADEVIPYDHGQALFAAAKGRKQFVTIPGGRHNDPPSAEFHRALDELLLRFPKPCSH